MKIFRIKNRRNSLATNSSSTHSVVYKNKDQVFEDLGIFDTKYYGRCKETIAASREAKIRYIFANIFRWDELVELMSMRYPEMKEYYPLVKEYYDIYCNDKIWEELSKSNGDNWNLWDERDSYMFGDHMRGNLYNHKELYLSYEFLCNIIDSPDIVIVGGSDEDDFVYDTIDGCDKISSRFSYMENIIDKVKNGNYYILYGSTYSKKEKVRLQVDSIPDMIPEYPELVDMKITNACEHKCPFCYMASTPDGKHANLKDIYGIISKFKIKTEFALGGGNVLLHPEFENIVRYIKINKHIANITIRYDDVDTINNNETIKNVIKKYVSGIGISVQKDSNMDQVESFINDMLDLGKHVSLHIIPEMLGVKKSVKILEKMNDINKQRQEQKQDDFYDNNKCKVIFLGLKQVGRAKNMEHNLLTEDELNTLFKACYWQLNVDTAFINTYNDWFNKEYQGDERFFLTKHEGEFSMFIDSVKMQGFTSSYKDDGGIAINDDTKLNKLFGEIRRKNGFKVFEKPEPYYRK